MDIEQILTALAAGETVTIDELAAAKTELETVKADLTADIKNGKSLELSKLVELKTEYDAVAEGLATVTTALESAQAEVDAIIAQVDDTTDETPADEVADEGTDTEVVDEVEVPVAASIRKTLARVRTRPVVEDTGSDLSRVDTTYSLLGRDRDTVAPSEIGKAFADTARKHKGQKTTVLSIKTDLAPERTLNGDASANERKMLDLFGANPVVPVTAAGGCCSIPEPIYEQPLVGSLARPIRDSMDVMNASRGAVQAYPPVCIPDSGADIWTCVQDAAVDPDDDTTWKTCTAIACEDSAPTLVEPIYKCLTIGTFQQRYAPEQWEAYLFQTDKLAARLAEARLFDWLVSSATSTHTGFDTGSTMANFIKSLVRGGTLIRQDQRLGDAQLVAYGPDWIYAAILEDSLGHRYNNVDEAEILRDKVDRLLANEGIRYIGSQDVADLEDYQYDGALASYPATAPVVLLPAGSAKVLDGGEKNLGVDVPDFDLARQNNVGAFSEFWEGLLVRNCNIKSIEIPVNDCSTILCPGSDPAPTA